jgi:type IV secretion/conjugal transfer VirB4 family ATPase
MVNLRRVVRAYKEAGSVNSLLAVFGFVTDEMFLTKAGHVGLVYRISGADYGCLEPTERQAIVHRYEAAIRLLDESCRVYQYLCKRRIEPIRPSVCRQPVAADAIARRAASLNDRRAELYDVDVFLVVVYEGFRAQHVTARRLLDVLRRPCAAIRERLSINTVLVLIQAEIDRAIAQLDQKARAFEVQLADTIRPARLSKADAFRFLRRLVNYTPKHAEGATLRYDTHVDYFMADSPVECHPTWLDVDGAVVKVLSMKEPPGRTFAHLLEDLYTIPGECIACLEWRRLSSAQMRRDVHRRRRHFFNKRISLVNYVAPDTKHDDMLVDDSASATVTQLGDLLTDMEVHGHFLGECSLTLVLYDQDRRTVERAAAEATKVMAAHDGTLIEESYNLLNAWLSMVPGNSAHNRRYLALLETNYADLSFLFGLDPGQPTSAHLGREALAVFETPYQTRYFFNLHVQDVGHTVVLGATGSGKSFLLNFLTLHAQQYDPLTVIFDLGHSYRTLAARVQGSYLQLGLRPRDVRINPFAFDPTPEHLNFLQIFVRVLLEGADAYRLSDAEDRELYDAIENLYVLDREQRRLFTLANLLPRALAARLSTWVEGGRYAELFDHVDDTLSVHRFQVFDFEAMRSYPALLEPLLFYVLHRVTAHLDDPAEAGHLKLCVMDEAWRFIQHDRLRAYIEEALKTWRKRNAAMLLATQTIDDFASADLLRTVVESCPTKLLLANPALDRARYAELFQLTGRELDVLVDLVPRQQFLLKRPDLAKVLVLNVDERARQLYTDVAATGTGDRLVASA